MRPLVLYHDFTSPFCRLTFAAAREAAAAAGIPLALAPFELRPEGVPITGADAEAIASELVAARPIAQERGLALAPPPQVPRTAKAHEAVAFAAEHERALEMAEAIYHAFWTRGEDIGRIDVLVALAPEAGVETEALHFALGLDRLRGAVADAQREADAAGVVAVPALEHAGRWLRGVVAGDAVEEWLRERV